MVHRARRQSLALSGERLTSSEFYDVVLHDRPAHLAARSRARMHASYRVVRQAAAQTKPVYGVNTGFGKLADKRIPRSDIFQLQVNLVRSHAAGVGDPLTREEAR